jgi:hypothetical protein
MPFFLEKPMSQTKSIVLLTAAILAGALSLPLEWFTLTNVDIESAKHSGSVSAWDGATLFSIPIWVLVATALVANVLQILDKVTRLGIPNVLISGITVAALIGMLVTILVPMVLQGVTANEGAFLGFLSAAIPVVAITIGAPRREPTVAG